MPTGRLRVIPQPAPNTVPVLRGSLAPIASGQGEDTYLCGSCETTLIENVSPGDLSPGTAVRCPDCRVFNEVA